MRWHTLILLFLLGVHPPSHAAELAPQRFVLNNGLVVVLAPNPPSREIEIAVQVDAGWQDEAGVRPGLAHLMEHLVLRDLRGTGSLGFPGRFKSEVGGKISGETRWKTITFLAKVPSLKGVWALNEFHRMLFNRSFSKEELERAKVDVWKEIGEPTDPLLGFLESLNPNKWESVDFFKSEFGVDSHPGSTELIRRSLARTSLDEVNGFYRTHFAPNYITLFYSGPFREKESLTFIRETFESVKSGSERDRFELEINPRLAPYVRSRLAHGSPWYSAGVKFSDIGPQDEVALQVLFRALNNQFSQELNQPDSAVTGVEPRIWIDEQRFGYATLSFDLVPLGYREERNRLQSQIIDKSQRLGLTETEFNQAKSEVREQYENSGDDAAVTLAQAMEWNSFRRRYRTDHGPAHFLDELNYRDARERIAALFSEPHRYTVSYEPPLVSRHEGIAVWTLFALLTLFGFRYRYGRNFPHTKIRYLRKVKYQPLFYFLAVFVFFNLLWVLSQTFQVLQSKMLALNWWQSSYLLSHYFSLGIFTTLVTALTLMFLGSIPHKLMVVDGQLWIKSFSFRSRRIDRDMIHSVFTCRPYQLVSMGFYKDWPRVFHFSLWKKGLFLDLKDGSAYYLGFTNADQVLRELNDVFQTKLQINARPDWQNVGS